MNFDSDLNERRHYPKDGYIDKMERRKQYERYGTGFCFEEKLNTFIIANVMGGGGQFESGKTNKLIHLPSEKFWIRHSCENGKTAVLWVFSYYVSAIKFLAHLQICRHGFVFPCALQLSALKPSEILSPIHSV